MDVTDAVKPLKEAEGRATWLAQEFALASGHLVLMVYGKFYGGWRTLSLGAPSLLAKREGGDYAVALQMLKQLVAAKVGRGAGDKRFWQRRYYDFNVHSERKRVEKLKYIHRNPVTRGLADRPEDWEWSSFRHYATGVEGVVEIESEWTARRRERMGFPLHVRLINSPTLSPTTGNKGRAPTNL